MLQVYITFLPGFTFIVASGAGIILSWLIFLCARAPRKPKQRLFNITVAYAGLCTVYAVLCPVFLTNGALKSAGDAAHRLRLTGRGLLMYCPDHDGMLPPTSTWATAIEPYTASTPNPFTKDLPTPLIVDSPFAFAASMRGFKQGDNEEGEEPEIPILLSEAAANTYNAAVEDARHVVLGRHWCFYALFRADGSSITRPSKARDQRK